MNHTFSLLLRNGSCQLEIVRLLGNNKLFGGKKIGRRMFFLTLFFDIIGSSRGGSDWPFQCPLGRVWLVQLIADRNSTFWKCRLHPANPNSLNRKFRFGIKIPLKPVNAADVFIILCHFVHFEF